MTLFVDARVPVVFAALADVGPGDAVLIEGAAAAPKDRVAARFDLTAPGHVAGCACCVPRSAVADALARLFAARARAEVAFFGRVVAVAISEAGESAIREALASDPVVSARYRLVPSGMSESARPSGRCI